LADQGRTFAETMLGRMYLDAAEQGNAVAQSILGFIYGTVSAALRRSTKVVAQRREPGRARQRLWRAAGLCSSVQISDFSITETL
jgi:hypothetical protein